MCDIHRVTTYSVLVSHETDEATESGKEHQKRDKTKRVRVLNIKKLIYNVYLLQQFWAKGTNSDWVNRPKGRLAQLVERTLSMREVEGSKPSLSIVFSVDTENWEAAIPSRLQTWPQLISLSPFSHFLRGKWTSSHFENAVTLSHMVCLIEWKITESNCFSFLIVQLVLTSDPCRTRI